MAAISAATIALGAVTLPLPWHRWRVWTQIWAFAPPVTALLTLYDYYLCPRGDMTAIYSILLAAWVGITFPQRTVVAILPLIAFAFLLPIELRHEPSGSYLAEMLQLLLVCLVVGEALSWVAKRLRAVERTVQSHVQRMEVLLHTSTSLMYDLEPADATETVAGLGAELLHAKRSEVYVVGTGGELVSDRRRHDWRPIPDGARECLREQHVVVEDRRGSYRVFLPLVGGAGPLGVVHLDDCPPDAESTYSRDIAETYAMQAGLALERAWLKARLVDRALRDELTGLPNRRAALAALARVQEGDAVALIDFDHFKEINDTLGHAAGDDVLRLFGAFLHGTLRASDDTARYGGEEFLVILRQETDPLSAMERIRREWNAQSPPTSFSAGVVLHDEKRTAAETVNRADKALYDAKSAGRDRVRMARPGEENEASPQET
jgi:diguanylate cyclase (GGDEF)-like protein